MATVDRSKLETIFPPGGRCVHVDMPNERYHACGNWSHSQLKHLPEDPEAFQWKYILKREEFDATRAMVMGTAFHAWLLEGIEPTLVPKRYLNKAGAMRPGAWDEVAIEFPDIPVLKADELQALCYARENCYADPRIRDFLETDGWVEHSLFSTDQATGLPTRVRLDKLCRFADGLDCLDLKFSAGCDDRWVEKQVTGMGYYSQAGMYWEHVERAYERPKSWVFLFVRNTPPFTARLKELAYHDVELGMRHTHVQLQDLRYRLDGNYWKGPGFGQVGLTQVSRWKWEEDPAPIECLEEFSQFATSKE